MNLFLLKNACSPISNKISNTFFALMLLLSLPALISAQSWTFSSYDGRNNDGIAIFPLVDIPGNTIIFITEDEYSDTSNTFFSDEGHIMLTIPASGLLAGTVISIRETPTEDTYTTIGGGETVHVAGSGNWSLVFGDEVYIYEASNVNSPWNSITDIHSFLWTSGATVNNDQKILLDYPNSISTAFNIGQSASGVYEYLGSRIGTTREMLNDPDNWTNSSTTVASFNMDPFQNPAVPVELTRFTAKLTNSNTVLLDWNTASETNNDFFEVQYSTDAKNYRVLGKVEGVGISTVETNYEFLHTAAMGKFNYYRLAQVDYDGKTNYSDVLVVKQKHSITEVTVVPNPFTQAISLNISENGSEIRSIEVFNMEGKIMKTEQYNHRNKNSNLDLSQLTNGTYILRILFADNTTEEKKIIKVD